MSWLNYEQGKTPAELTSGSMVHGGGLPSLNRQNPFAEAIKAIAPAIMQYMKQKRNDEIANQLMGLEQSRKATPVMENGQMVSGGGPMDAAGVQRYNSDLGYPGRYRTPDMGGQESLQVHDLYQKHLDQQQEDQMQAADAERKGRLQEAQIARLNAPADDPGNPTAGMTPYQRELLRLREMDIKRKQDRYAKPGSIPDSVIPRAEAHVGAAPSDGASTGSQPTDSAPVKVSSPEEAKALPPGTYYVTPDGKKYKR